MVGKEDIAVKVKVPAKKHRHHRGGLRKRIRKDNNVAKGCFSIAYSNVQNLGVAKQNEIGNLLEKEKFTLYCMTETFHRDDGCAPNIHPHYQWVGKARSEGYKKSGGGLGFLIHSNVDICDDNVLNSKQDNFERLWVSVKMHSNQKPLMVCLAYFPNDGIDSENSANLNAELIDNVASLKAGGHECLILGDFNGVLPVFRAPRKRSPNGDLLSYLIEITNLNVLNCHESCSGRYTWQRGNLKSVIDYALATDGIFNEIESVTIDELALYDVGSDHNAVVIQGQAGMSADIQKPLPRVKWNIKESTDWALFRDKLDVGLAHWNCNAFNTVNEAWCSLRDMLMAAGDSVGGKKKCTGKIKYSGDEEIRSLIQNRKQANRFYRYWSKRSNEYACSPEFLQELWDDYMSKKHKIQEKIRVKSVRNKIQVVLQNSRKGTKNTKAYWRMLRRLNKNNDFPLRIIDPKDCTRTIVDPKEISETLADYWRNIGSNGKIQSSCINDIMRGQVDKLMNYNGDTTGLSSIEIHFDNVKEAISKLKNGKACGVDHIPNEFLKNGGTALITSLVDMFNMCKTLEVYPDQWFQGYIKPIHKEGSKEILSNYRGITVTSNIYKVFTSIVENQFMRYLEQENILGEMHGAYRRHRRLEDQVFILKGICNLRKRQKLKTWISFLDISKAFDTVNRERLFLLLWEKGIQGKAWRLIKGLYDKVENKVIFGAFESSWFETLNGVKQGCILSPTLFSLVMLDLIDQLKKGNIGVPFRNDRIPCLLYADDIALLAENEDQLNCMLNIAQVFASKWNMTFNCSKSKVMVVGKRVDSNKKWMLGDNFISECKTYKYLGIIFSSSLKDSPHVKELLVPKGTRLRGYLSSILSSHLNVNRVSFGNTIWKSIIWPSISHGAAVWVCNTKESEASLKSLQYAMAKAILQVNSSPSMAATIGELGWLPCNVYLEHIRVKYFHRMKFDLPDTRLCKQIFDSLFEPNSGNTTDAWPYVDEMRKTFNNVCMDRVFRSTNPNWLRRFAKLSIEGYKLHFFQEIDEKRSLNWYRMFKRSTFGEKYLFSVDNFAGVRLKFLARTGCLGLGEDLKRWNISDGKCVLCNSAEEDLPHFLFLCPALNQIRSEMYVCLERECKTLYFDHVWQRFSASSLNNKICWLLGEHLYEFGREIGDAFDRISKDFLVKAWHFRRQSISDPQSDLTV